MEGAFAESCDLMELFNVMMNLLDEPEAMHELLFICLKQAERFALEQLRCGAQIIGIGDAAASLIGPSLYEEFVLPYQQQLIQSIHAARGLVKLHICGNITPILPYIALTKADIVDCDHMVDLSDVIRILPKGTGICGNLDPVYEIMHSNPAEIKKTFSNCNYKENSYTIAAAGCDIPQDTPRENLIAFHDACR